MSNIKIINRQHKGKGSHQDEDVLSFFWMAGGIVRAGTYKSHLHLDRSHPSQSSIHIYLWSGSEWKEVYRMFGATARDDFDWDVEKIEKHMAKMAMQIADLQ